MTDMPCACGRPTSGAALCDACQTTLGYALVHVGVYWVDLETVATKRTRYGSGAASKGSIGKVQPMPLDPRFVDQVMGRDVTDDPTTWPARRGAHLAPGSKLRWDTWRCLVQLCRSLLALEAPVQGPVCEQCLHLSCAAGRRRRFDGRTVPRMVGYLARQHRLLVAQAWAPAALDALVDLEHRLQRLIDRPADRWYAGKCSARAEEDPDEALCAAELYATTEAGTIRCKACGTLHDIAGRRDFLLEEAKTYLVTATEAAGALLAWTDYDGNEENLVKRISKWRDRGRLEVGDVTSLNGRDRHLYRLGDIQELLVDDAQVRQNRRLDASA